MRLRNLMRWVPVVVASCAIAASLAAPTTAAAADARFAACPAIYPQPAWCGGGIEPTYATAGTNHVGWVYLNLNYCPPGAFCTKIHRVSTSAWSWNGSAWSSRQLRGGWVYVYPYTGEWRWAWTQESGWVAISGHRFERR